MCRNYDTSELNAILKTEGFKGDISEEIEVCDEMLQECEIDENWELEGTYE